MNISDSTRKVLAKYPYLDNYMAMGIVNNRGLARLVQPEVARELDIHPNIQSIVTALRRESKSKKRLEKGSLEHILAGSNVNLRYDMAAVTLAVGQSNMEKTRRKLLPEGSYILLQGLDSMTLIAHEDLIKKVGGHLNREVMELYENLAIVVVKSPKEIAKTPGVLAHLANILAMERINIVEMMSSHAETAFIIEEKDALRTIEVLRREIKRSRKTL